MHLFPFLSWIKRYNRSYFKHDASAGLTVGVMLIPQGMAYAMIAGLPPQYGLYAALFPQIIYALMGTSRQLAVGPVATDSLLVAAGIGALSINDPTLYIAMAIFLAFYMGVIQLILGGLKLGFVVNFLSKPVINGFTSAAALIIGFNQLDALLGLSIPKSDSFLLFITSLFRALEQTHPFTLCIGLAGSFFLIGVKKYFPKLPGALILMATTTLLAATLNWEAQGIQLINEIPSGLPNFVLPALNFDQIYALTPLALTLALIAFMEAISVAKAIEEKENTPLLDPNQELIALGTANVVGSFFQAYPTTGGFSRTAVNYDAGAKTGLSALFSAAVVGVTLLFFTSFFHHLPKATLGAIIVVAVINLIDVRYPINLWKNNRQEFFILNFTFLATLWIGIKEGLLFGVLIALIHVIYQHSRPHIAVLGRIENTHYFKNIDRFATDVVTYPKVLILRFDGPLFFGNQGYFRSQINALIKKQPQPLQHLVIAAAPIHYIDATAMQMLNQWVEEANNKGITIYWTGLNGPQRDQFHQLGMVQRFDRQFFYSSLDAALNAIQGTDPSPIEKSIASQRNNH